MKRWQFWSLVQDKIKEGQRKGQAVFNVAYDWDINATGTACAKGYDPYYDDSLIDKFLGCFKFEEEL